jgi:PhnB protein
MRAFLPIPKGEQTVMPYLTVKNAEAAIAFYSQVFDAKELGRLVMMGMIGHAELQIGDCKIMLTEENLDWGSKSPATLGGSPVTIALYVADVDASFQRAVDAGATATMPVKDEFYGLRVGVVVDPFGYKWHISTPIETVSFDEMQKRCDAMFAGNA